MEITPSSHPHPKEWNQTIHHHRPAYHYNNPSQHYLSHTHTTRLVLPCHMPHLTKIHRDNIIQPQCSVLCQIIQVLQYICTKHLSDEIIHIPLIIMSVLLFTSTSECKSKLLHRSIASHGMLFGCHCNLVIWDVDKAPLERQGRAG